MASLTIPEAVALVQEVADAVEALLDMAVFPSRIHSDDDGDAFPEHVRYLLAMHNLTTGLGLTVQRSTESAPEEGSDE